MKKLLATILISVMLASTIPVFATPVVIGTGETVSTGVTVPEGGGDPPIVKAKWEAVDKDPNAIDTSDDDSCLPGTQILPPVSYLGKVGVEYCEVIMDPDGKGNIIEAYADVYHPDGSFKYEIELTEVPTGTPLEGQAAANLVQSAYDNGILAINTAEGFTLDEVKDELQERSAKLFCGEADLDYHQMCGEYVWEGECTGTCPGTGCVCTGYRHVSGEAYTVKAYGVDVEGSGREYFENNFEYICTAGVELDFDSINWENVKAWSLSRDINTKWVEGDWVWNTPIGPACKGDQNQALDCRPPTIRNIGNTPVYLGVAFDDMGFGKAGTKWNVDFDASMKENAEVIMDPVSAHNVTGGCAVFNPAGTTILPDSGLEPEPYCEETNGVLDLCDTEKLTFSIHVYKSPVSGATYSGCTLIDPIPLTFPWWTDTSCNGCAIPCPINECPGTMDCVSGCCVD